MAKLWNFGDSFSTPFDNFTFSPNASKYLEWKGYTPLIYSQIIAKHLSYDVVCRGKGGLDNYSIFERVCEHLDLIQDNDILIIGWTLPARFRMVNDFGENISVMYNMYEHLSKDMKSVSPKTLEEVLVHRYENRDVFEYENYLWTTLINKSLNCRIIHYKFYSYNFGKYETIMQETNGLIMDRHHSEKGHLILSEDMLSVLNNGDRINYMGDFIKNKKRTLF